MGMYVGAYVGVLYVGMTMVCLNSRAASTCCRPASSTTAMAAAPAIRAADICRLGRGDVRPRNTAEGDRRHRIGAARKVQLTQYCGQKRRLPLTVTDSPIVVIIN